MMVLLGAKLATRSTDALRMSESEGSQARGASRIGRFPLDGHAKACFLSGSAKPIGARQASRCYSCLHAFALRVVLSFALRSMGAGMRMPTMIG